MNETAHRQETEPAGITYDRLRLDRMLTNLVRRHGIREVLEIPTDGAKAMPALYSLCLARAGCTVTLFNPDPQGVAVWERLGLRDQLRIVEGDDPARTAIADRSFDLVWNFVTASFRPDFGAVVGEMHRVSRRHVLTVHMNGYNWGYPWHRFLHRIFDLPWTHGETKWFFPRNVRRVFRERGLEPVEYGLFDMPWWPDPPGFRDVRLHLKGGDIQETSAGIRWAAPIEQVYASGVIPPALRVLSRIEDRPIPEPIRTVFSHLFYIRGERMLR